MGYAAAIMAVASMAISASQQSQQRKSAEAQEEQARLDAIASQSSTEQAERDQAEQEAMDLSTLAREAMSTEATVMAQSAYSGVAGVTPDRIRNNVLFQKSLDEANIRSDSMNTLWNIRTSGRQNMRQIDSMKAMARASKPSGTASAINIVGSGVSTYASLGGFSGGARAGRGLKVKMPRAGGVT